MKFDDKSSHYAIKCLEYILEIALQTWVFIPFIFAAQIRDLRLTINQTKSSACFTCIFAPTIPTTQTMSATTTTSSQIDIHEGSAVAPSNWIRHHGFVPFIKFPRDEDLLRTLNAVVTVEVTYPPLGRVPPL
jgi:hypothetical protein